MNKLKINFLFLLIILTSLLTVRNVTADAVIDNGLNYLKSQQDSTGRITNGFSAPSQWSAIAFAANGINMSDIKNPAVSLEDFLKTNIPSEPSASTDWETRILAIVATGGDPTNYGGVNYINRLESFYSNNQFGDECSLNDDIFGLLAEIAAGSTSNSQIKQGVLSYLISKQDSSDGGFGYSAPSCAWYSTSSDMTGAAIQALVSAKNNGLIDSGLDNAINRAKNYLLTNQNTDGGFGYYGSSDSDSTGWVLMAFNILDMKDATASANLKNWLLTQQSSEDGGFLAFDYGLNKSVSNSTTTAQAVIALSGRSWILKIFDPNTISPSPFASPEPTAEAGTLTPTITPTPLLPTQSGYVGQAPTTTPTPTVTPSPTIHNDPKSLDLSATTYPQQPTNVVSPNTTSAKILGVQAEEVKPIQQKPNKNFILPFIFLGLGILSLIIHKSIITK